MQLCTDCIKSSATAVIFSQALKACPNSKKNHSNCRLKKKYIYNQWSGSS